MTNKVLLLLLLHTHTRSLKKKKKKKIDEHNNQTKQTSKQKKVNELKLAIPKTIRPKGLVFAVIQ